MLRYASIQKGTINLGAGDTSATATIAAVDTSRAFVLASVRTDTSAANQQSVSAQLTNDTTVTVTRLASGAAAVIEYTVVEFASGATVQRGSTTIPGASTSNTATISSVATGRAWVIHTQRYDGSGQVGSSTLAREALTNATTITFTRGGAAGDLIIEWQVVEFETDADGTVQRGEATLASAQTQVDVALGTAVTLARSFPWVSMSTGTGGPQVNNLLVQPILTGPTGLRIQRVGTSNTNIHSWQVVELASDWSVQQVPVQLANGDTNDDDTITAVVLADSFALVPTNGRYGMTGNTGNNLSTGSITTSLTGTTTLNTQRGPDVGVLNTQAIVISGVEEAPAPPPTVDAIDPATGSTLGGTSVTITGTGFISGATVSIGGNAATSVVVVDSETITAIAPAHAAGAVDVVVTNPDTQSDTLAGGFTYAAPTLSSFSVTETSGAALGNFRVGIPKTVRISAIDNYGGVLPSFTDTVNITATGAVIASGGGTSAPFTAGVLDVAITFNVEAVGVTVDAADTDTGLITGQSAAFSITAAATGGAAGISGAAQNLGSFILGATISAFFNTQDASGEPVTFSGTLRVINARTRAVVVALQAFTANVTVDGAPVVGLNAVDILASGAGWAAGEDYALQVITGDVDGISVAGRILATWSVNAGVLPTNSVNGDALAATAVAEIQAGLATAAGLTATQAAVIAAVPTAAANADALLGRNQQGGSNAAPTVSAALAAGLMLIDISLSTGVMTVRNGDGTTAFQRNLTRAQLNAIVNSAAL